ncbi:hypothetical protein [Enterococcus cecorum]|uniref:hypothetical protein n=1 Tax=Enterococcus cecorum TaxID=44008 RepID=UPI00200A7E31|nr:hypothetical protein [Enterococcus cecorum]
MKVQFFEDSLVSAIGAGVYQIFVKTEKEEKLLYVGESVFVLVRCATHLYEISKGNGYLGFDKNIIGNKDITVVFKLYQNVEQKSERVAIETKLIKEAHPVMQSGIKDRVKPIENMIAELKNILNN